MSLSRPSACLGADGGRVILRHTEPQGGCCGRSPALLGESAGSTAEKRAQVVHRPAAKILAEDVEDFLPGQAAAIDDSVRRLEFGDVFGRVAASPQAHDVEANDAATLAIDEHVRWDVLNDTGVAADHCQPANAAKLVDSDGTGDEGPVFDDDVAAEK